MWSHRICTACRAAPVLALALAATLLVSALGPAVPARAADLWEVYPQPVVRVQVVVKEIYIWDERELWGDGDFELAVFLNCYAAPRGCPGPANTLDLNVTRLSGGRGETLSLDLALPQSSERFHPDFEASVDAGYPLYFGHVYELGFYMTERDAATNDEMGKRTLAVRSENGWGLGTHRLRSTNVDRWGDFTVEFEIRPAPLADLRPVAPIKVHDIAGSTRERVCMTVVNGGVADAGPFEVALHVNGVESPGGRATVDGLVAGGSRQPCLEADVPDAGPSEVGMVIDGLGLVTEISETNNSLDERIAPALSLPAAGPAAESGLPATNADPVGGTDPSPSPTPTQTPGPSQAAADLIVKAIRVNGRAPDGNDDCKDGKNDIAVVVKNAGSKKAGDFAVRLVFDDDSGTAREDLLGDGLDAGQEYEVRFDDVRLKKGERTLLAIGDPKNGITESSEDNNELKVTARCKDDD